MKNLLAFLSFLTLAKMMAPQKKNMIELADPTKPADPDDSAQVLDVTWSDAPLKHRKNLFFTGHTALKIQPNGNTPADFFNLLVTDELYNDILQQTNAYAEEVFLSSSGYEKARITQWKPLTKEEFRVFLGLFFHMGTIHINRLQDYWRTHHLFNLVCFSQRMSRNRFLLILRCLHLAKNPLPDKTAPLDKLHKIRPIVDYFNKRMFEVYSPSRELSIDESLLAWRGRLGFRQYLPGKAHKYGIKTYVLAEPNGLTLKLLVYSGAKDITGGVGHASKVVLQLMREHFDKGHSLFMDNFYNSHSLVQKLLERATYCTGTLRANRKNNCRDVVNTKLKPGDVIAKCDELNGIIMGKWRDKREVTFISTEYSATLQETQNRRGQKKMKPEAIIYYNKFMSGVEHKDQMLAYNACDRKTIRWYKKLGLHTLQILLLNAWYLYNKYSGLRANFYDFRLNIIENLVGGTKQEKPKKAVPEGVHLPASLPKAEATKGRVQRKDCKVCYQNKIRKQTNFYCPKCKDKPGLCLEPCFRIFHGYDK
ncbi:piggyBac transposable element-derived protein 4-like isoform X2 [Zophobas morio]|uniref:piggyBac transposable element-derived protein 4-like isoform X2 n=1 Tax=Zophobas morio TaxID=2755281 RepID=UPI003083663D